MQLSYKAPFCHFTPLGLPDYLSAHPFYAHAASETHPIPHSSQQDSRSSAEISREILLPLWMHSLSDMASAAPKACGKLQKSIFFASHLGLPVCLVVSLTQQDPQDPWSLICWIVGHSGHCLRASKLSGSLIPSVLWTLSEKIRTADKSYLLTVTCVNMWDAHTPTLHLFLVHSVKIVWHRSKSPAMSVQEMTLCT